MKVWLIVLAVVLPGTIILALLIAFLIHKRWFVGSDAKKHSSETWSRMESFQSALGKLHISYKSHSSKRSLRFHHLNQLHIRQQQQQQQQQQIHKPAQLFDWNDHPQLICEAVENGWSKFAFMGRSSSLPPRSVSLMDFCVVGDYGRQKQVETNWEVPVGSSDFMQTVRLNPGLKRTGNNSSTPLDGDESYCCARMALPLPGPLLGGSSFPEEGYFEITILHLQQLQQPSRTKRRAKVGTGEEDKLKLIQDNSLRGQSGELIHDGGGLDKCTAVQEENFTNEEDSNVQDGVICLGFTRGGSPPNKVPGSYPGSIGFNSNGAVYLDGVKLVFESDKVHWGAVNRVIGCGFDPSKKKVFFTLDSVLLHVIQCNSDAFKSPLYPCLAANADIMVLVNLGQSAFKYMPANVQRTPNPCFLRPLASGSPAVLIGEDSHELFSMENIGSQWHEKSATKKSNCNNTTNSNNNSCNTTPNTKNNNNDNNEGSLPADVDANIYNNSKINYSDGSVVVDIDAESDLFEIALNR